MPDRMERAGALAHTCTCALERILRCGYFLVRYFAIASFAIAAANAEEKRTFNIAAGPAAESLNQYARQAGVEIGFPVGIIGDVRTNAVRGAYEASEALDLLIEGTGLVAKNEREGFIIRQTSVTQPESEPEGTQSTQSGDAEFPRKGTLLEEIVVTGSHIRGAGNVGVSAISFDRAELAKTGYSTVEELFESLPQNLDEITPIGAVATGASNLAGFNTQGATAINLRGLGTGSTLVLMNGKRRPGNINGRVVDVSAIPLAMVERVEIVTGGYSAIYGSDAVAGVVNVITRTEFDGAETQAYYGRSSAGGERFNLSQTLGRGFEKGSFVVGYDYREDQRLDAADTGVLRTPSREGLTPIPGLFHIQGAATRHVGLLAGHLDLTSKVEIYADAQFAVAEYKTQFAYQIAGCCDLDTHIVTDSDQYSAVGGARFDIGSGWSIDVSALQGTVDSTAAGGSLFTSAPGMVNRTDPRPTATEHDNDKAQLRSFSAIADGSLRPLGNESISAAIGVDYRTEHYLRTSTPLATAVERTLQERERDIWSIFGEVHLPLVGQDRKTLTASLAARYDDYSDFGDTFNPQIGLEWEPVRGLALRGSFAKAFRAPELFELSRETRVRVANLVDPLDPTGQTTATVLIDSGGNSELRPERADTYTLAVDWRPSDNAKISMSYFNIEYDGRIDTPDSFSGGFAALENESLYPSLIDRNPTPAQVNDVLDRAELIINNSGIPFDRDTDDPFAVFRNIIIFDNRTNNVSLDAMEGLDFQASAAWEADSGHWSLGLNGTFYLDFERNITPTSPTVDQLNQPGRPVDLRFRGHLAWSGTAWDAHAFVNFVDSYRDTVVDPSIPIDSWTTVDLTIGFDTTNLAQSHILAGLTTTLGINNLFDEPPPVLLNNDLGLGYDAINANPVGRFVSLRFAKRW